MIAYKYFVSNLYVLLYLSLTTIIVSLWCIVLSLLLLVQLKLLEIAYWFKTRHFGFYCSSFHCWQVANAYL